MKNHRPVYYGNYLQLPKILNAQFPESAQYGDAAHDEMLFIIIHQTYELWFKQILHELNSVAQLMGPSFISSRELARIQSRLARVTTIQQILIDQIHVMETMSTVDFMEFRDFLVPASGFQSLQFRLIEAKLGIKPEHRMEIEKQFFNSRLSMEDRKSLEQAEQETSILELLEQWLSRMPFSRFQDFDFWQAYQGAVHNMLKADEEIIQANSGLSSELKQMELKNLASTRKSFGDLLNAEAFKALRNSGQVRLSQEAMLAAVFICLYRDYPALQMPYKILNTLVEIDEKFTTWRYRHAIMVQRILGTKIGTGGSSGHEYLKSTTERNRAFVDLFTLATYLLPREQTPQLPKALVQQLDIVYDSIQT